MAETAQIGVDVLVKLDGDTVLGQRDATMTYPIDMVDLSCKSDYPYKKFQPSWEGPITIECEGLLMAGGSGGAAGIVNKMKARTTYEFELTIGDSGEKFTGDAWITNPGITSPQAGEATFRCTLQVDGEMVATAGA